MLRESQIGGLPHKIIAHYTRIKMPSKHLFKKGKYTTGNRNSWREKKILVKKGQQIQNRFLLNDHDDFPIVINRKKKNHKM